MVVRVNDIHVYFETYTCILRSEPTDRIQSCLVPNNTIDQFRSILTTLPKIPVEAFWETYSPATNTYVELAFWISFLNMKIVGKDFAQVTRQYLGEISKGSPSPAR